MIRKHPYAVMLALSTIGLGMFLSLTNPENVPIGALIVPIVLFFFIAFCAIQIILPVLHVLKGAPRKQRMVSLISASLLTVIVILQSSGGISAADVVLLGLIVVVAAIYIDRF